MRNKLFGAVAALLGVAVTLGFAEIAVRLVVPSRYWTFTDASSDWIPDPQLGWVNRPNFRVESTMDTGLVDFATNADGLLPAPAIPDKKPGVRRVMLFGDSIVMGRAVAEKDRIHNRLQQLLSSAEHPVEVLNAAVQGYSTDQVLLLMERLVPIYHPDVVVYGLCQNDFEGNGWTRNYGTGKPRCEVRNGTVLCNPPNQEEVGLWVEAHGGWRMVLQHSALYRLLQPGILAVRMKFMKANYAGTGLAPELYEGAQPSAIPSFDLFVAMLVEMRRTAAQANARFLLYSHPAAEEVWDPAVNYLRTHGHPRYDRYWLEHTLAATAAQNAVDYCPLIDQFRADQSKGPFHLLPRDPHCNRAGYAVTATKLGACLRTELGL